MVCKFDPIRMAAMMRLLSKGSYLEITAEEATQEEILVQTINREIHEANEANLLEEKDMHIFDSRPLTDPLYLVRCNACEKPIKASQYATHAEWCRALNSLQEIRMEPDADAGNKKSLKEGKKLRNGHSMAIGELEKSGSIDGDVAVSEFNLDEQFGTFSQPSRKGKNYIIKMENSGASHGSMHGKAGAPAPLATKMYHSQGSHHLRVAIRHLYYQSVANDFCSNPIPVPVQDNGLVSSSVAPPD